MIKMFKILRRIYDKNITEGILYLAHNDRPWGHSLKLSSTESSSTLEGTTSTCISRSDLLGLNH